MTVCAVTRCSFTVVIEMVAPRGTVRFSPRAVCTIFRGGVLCASQKPQTTNFADPVMIKPVLNPELRNAGTLVRRRRRSARVTTNFGYELHESAKCICDPRGLFFSKWLLRDQRSHQRLNQTPKIATRFEVFSFFFLRTVNDANRLI